MSEIRVKADLNALESVLDFVNEQLEAQDCPVKYVMQINVAVEEIFVNIANYAYPENDGDAVIRVCYDEKTPSFTITFMDMGIPYDPLAKEDPDVTLSAEERQIGGLGIFMVKKTMDDLRYEYKDNMNILSISKRFA